jgi:hypothetical protein
MSYTIISRCVGLTKSPLQLCRSDRDCPGFRRVSCEGRGPNFLFIFPTCGRQRPYTVSGRCLAVPDTLCDIGSEWDGSVSFTVRYVITRRFTLCQFSCFVSQFLIKPCADFFGGRNRCNPGARCASCLADQDCDSREVSGRQSFNADCPPQNCRSGRCVRDRECNNSNDCIGSRVGIVRTVHTAHNT